MSSSYGIEEDLEKAFNTYISFNGRRFGKNHIVIEFNE
jgi:hypothetical protein